MKEAIADVFRNLKHNSSVEKIFADGLAFCVNFFKKKDNRIGDKEAMVIAKALTENSSLAALNLTSFEREIFNF